MLRQIYDTRVTTTAIVSMSPGADAIRREMDDWRVTIVASDGLPSMLRSAVAKYEGLFPRLCLTFHVMSCAASRKYPTSLPITEATARRVADFMRRYLFPNAYAFYADIMGNASEGFNLAKRVGEFILATSLSRITRRDITHGCGSWRAAPDWAQNQAIAALEQAGWLIPGDAGKKVKAWTINPQVGALFAARSAAVKKTRAAASTILAELRDAKRG